MGCRILIFDEKNLCTAENCIDIQGENGMVSVSKCALAVTLVSSGRADISQNDNSVLISAGSIALSVSGATITPEKGSHLLCILLSGAAVKYAAEELCGHNKLPFITDAGACPMAAQLMEDVRLCFESGTRLPQSAFALLCELSSADYTARTISSLVTDAVSAIRRSYAGLYGVEELSGQLGVSKSHLVRTFSAEMGVSPGRYLTSVRIAEAQRLLAHREYTLEVIATLCGFSGANYLCKVFKKETGLSPASYREKYRANSELPQRSEAEDTLFV